MGQNGVWAEQEEEEEQEEQEEQEEEELTAVQRVCIGATGLRCGGERQTKTKLVFLLE